MSRRLKYGDVVRVNPEMFPNVPQPDDRRWMVVVVAATGREWVLSYLGGPLGPSGFLSHWRTMTGFIKVEEPR